MLALHRATVIHSDNIMNRKSWERYTGLPVEPACTVELKVVQEDRENRQNLMDTLRALGLYDKQPVNIPDRLTIGSTPEGIELVAVVGRTSTPWWSPNNPVRVIHPTPTLTVETRVYTDEGQYQTLSEPLDLLTDREVLRFRDLQDLRELCEKLTCDEPTPEP